MNIKENCKVKNDRKICLMCGSELKSEPLMILENMPATAQDIPEKNELAFERGIELKLCKCEKCGLIQFNCAPVSYYRDVIRAVGLSETMRNLRRDDYRLMTEKYGLKDGRFLECGCGRGEFLEVLKEFTPEAYGTENDLRSALCAKERIGEGHIANAFPEHEEDIFFGGGFDCFFSFNFLEHQPYPRTMLKSMYNNLKDGGYGLITVPSFEYILGEGRYYELIRDHIANYTVEALEALCESCGFEVLEEGFVGIGDTIRMIVRKISSKTPSEIFEKERAKSSLQERGEEAGLLKLKENCTIIRREVSDYIKALKAEGRTLSLWGAGHQGFTLAATTELSETAKYILDSADFKQGKFAPASHIPIVSPEYFKDEPTDDILIVAPGYAKEINETVKKKFKGLKGRDGREVKMPRVSAIRSFYIENMD